MLQTAEIFVPNLEKVARVDEPELGKHMRRLRSRSGLSQEEAAHRIGVSTGAYRAWEAGRVPRPGNRRRIASVFSVPVGELESYMVALRDRAPEPSRLERIESKLDAILQALAVSDDEPREQAAQAAEEAARRRETPPAESGRARARRRSEGRAS